MVHGWTTMEINHHQMQIQVIQGSLSPRRWHEPLQCPPWRWPVGCNYRRCEKWQCLIPEGKDVQYDRIVPTSVYFTNMLQWLENAAMKERHDILVENQLCWGFVIHMSREHSPTTWGWTWVMSDLGGIVSHPDQGTTYLYQNIYIYIHIIIVTEINVKNLYIYIYILLCTILYIIFV